MERTWFLGGLGIILAGGLLLTWNDAPRAMIVPMAALLVPCLAVGLWPQGAMYLLKPVLAELLRARDRSVFAAGSWNPR